jgi:hypothetical protein
VSAGLYPGVSPFCLLGGKGNWNASTAYVECDVVTYGGENYVCNTSHSSSTVFGVDAAYWDLLSLKGEPGGSQIVEVTSAGQVWMDRNLGALRVATKSADPDSYGSLYQWGRLGDGHEYRASPTTTTLSSGDVPNHGRFIVVSQQYDSIRDWRSTPNNNLWQGESGINNPCPAGFRLPTSAELTIEQLSWSSDNAAGAFASPLKLVLGGHRDRFYAQLAFAGRYGQYWTSTVSGGNSANLFLSSIAAIMQITDRANGCSVRCLKD